MVIKTALENPHLVVVVALATIVLGAVSYSKIPADLLPIFETPAVQIVTFYPGMPPEVMERDIMSRLERWTGQSVGIEHQEAKAMLGVSIVKDFFREEISLETAMSQVTSYAMSDLFYLPPGTIPPMVMPFDPTAAVPLCLVSVSSPTMNEKELYDLAYFELRNRLQSIQGVIAPAVYGGKLRRILAYVDREKLEARGLSPMDVVDALKRQNIFIPAGNMKAGDTDYQILANAMPSQVDQLNDIPIAVHNGAAVFLRDVARAMDSSQIQTNVVRINGRRQVYIPVYRQPKANTIEIVDAIKRNLQQILERLREMNPKAKDLSLEVVLDQSVYVRDSIKGLKIAGGLGAILASVIVFLFLRNARSTVIVVLAIPLSILAAFTGLYFHGGTINAMTLGGLALAVGILVDQSIVVIENVARHVRSGKSPAQAAFEGSREVAVPLFVSTLTFIVVFYPIVFLSGIAKFLFTPLAVAATLAITASYIISITLIPSYCARFLKAGRARGKTDAGDRLSVSIVSLYGRSLRKALGKRGAVLTLVGVLFALTLVLFALIGEELFPQVDAGQFQILLRLPSGIRIENTENAVSRIEQLIVEAIGEPDIEYPRVERYPESNLRMLISNIGVLMDWPAAYTPNTGPMDAFILVQLKNKWGMPGTFDYVVLLREKLREKFPEVEFSFDTGGMLTAALNMGEPAPIHIQVAGSNLETAHRIARLIARVTSKVKGTADVRIAQRLDYPVIDLEIDRVKAAYAGVSVENVMKNLVTATNSSVNFDPAFWIDPQNGNHYFIGAQYAEPDLVSLETLRDIPIKGSNGEKPVPLRTLARIERGAGPAVINHMNITRVIDVYATILPGYDIGSVVRRIERQLRVLPELGAKERQSDRGPFYEVTGPDYAGKGYTYSMSGEVRIMRDSFHQFLFGLVIAVILIYLVMAAQFKSFVDPLIILLTVPLGFIGVGMLLFLTGTSLNIQSLMGIIMMTGIVVEYSIILVDFANRRFEEGLRAGEAIIDAAEVRLRPILMTSLTTLLAILPMTFGIGGGEANVPLARAIVGGVLGATFLSLFVVPCLYSIMKRPRAEKTVQADNSHSTGPARRV